MSILWSLRATFGAFGKLTQKLRNIPFATATTRERTCPSGNGIHIETLLEQVLNIALLSAAAMAQNPIGRIGVIYIH